MLNAVELDDERTMYADEVPGRQQFRYRFEVHARKRVASLATENFAIVFHCFDVEYVGNRNHYIVVFLLDDDALFFITDIFQPPHCFFHGCLEPFVGERFVQEIGRIEVESVEGVANVGCGEDEAGRCRQFACDVETVQAVHLYVEENDVGLPVDDGLQSFLRFAVGKQVETARPQAELGYDGQCYGFVVYGDAIYLFHLRRMVRFSSYSEFSSRSVSVKRPG